MVCAISGDLKSTCRSGRLRPTAGKGFSRAGRDGTPSRPRDPNQGGRCEGVRDGTLTALDIQTGGTRGSVPHAVAPCDGLSSSDVEPEVDRGRPARSTSG